jgi:hypothetical protein
MAGEQITRTVSDRTRASIRRALAGAEAEHVIRLTTEAGFQVRVASMGLGMYRRLLARELDPVAAFGETQQFAELGCEHIICRGLVSCLDLCAASAYRIARLPARWANYEANVQAFSKTGVELARASGALPAPMATWLLALQASTDWKLLKAWRNQSTHGWVQHNLTIGPLRPATIVIDGTEHNLRTIAESLVDCTLQQFRDFVTAVEQSFP